MTLNLSPGWNAYSRFHQGVSQALQLNLSKARLHNLLPKFHVPGFPQPDPAAPPHTPATSTCLHSAALCLQTLPFGYFLLCLAKLLEDLLRCYLLQKPFLNPPCCIECPSLVSFCFSIIAISSSIYLFMCLPPSQHFNLLEVRNSYLTSYLEISMSVYLSILICPYISGYISKYHHVDVDLSLYPGRYSYLIRWTRLGTSWVFSKC